MNWLWFILLFQQSAFGQIASGGLLSPYQAAMDFTALNLVLKVDPEEKWIGGYAEITVGLGHADVEKLEFSLVEELEVSRVVLDGADLPFNRDGIRILIDLPAGTESPVKLAIHYQGHPRNAPNPPWLGGFNWSRTDSGKPWVGMSCQGEGGKIWFPSKDHPSDKIGSLSLAITVPKPLFCAANGLLDNVLPAEPGWHTFFWRSAYPISTYNVSINIAEYDVLETTYQGSSEMPVVFYVLKEYQQADQTAGDNRSYQEKRQDILTMTPAYLAFFAKKFGEYPFIGEKFGLVHTDYLGMEHQTINSYGNHFLLEDGVDTLLIHEMGHEWWGNKVTVSDWRDFWIHEGICTYATAMYIEETQGLEAYLKLLSRLRSTIANQNPVVGPPNSDTNNAYSGDIYNKGAVIIHGLRFLLGKEVLDRLLFEFAQIPEKDLQRTVSTEDFMALANSLAQANLDWYFKRYLYTKDLPTLRVVERGGKLKLSWGDRHFPMPIEIATGTAGDWTYHRVEMPGGKATFELPENGQHEIDPRGWVLLKSPEKR